MSRKLMMNSYSENGLMPVIYFNFCDYDKYVFLNNGIMKEQSIDIVSDDGNHRFVGVKQGNESRPASTVLTKESVIKGLDCRVINRINRSMELDFDNMTEITIVVSYRYNNVSNVTLIITNLGTFRHTAPTLFLFGDRQRWTEPTVNMLPVNKLSIGTIISTPDLAEYYNDGELVVSTNNVRKTGDMNKIFLNYYNASTDYTIFSLSVFNRVLSKEEVRSVYENEFNKFSKS